MKILKQLNFSHTHGLKIESHHLAAGHQRASSQNQPLKIPDILLNKNFGKQLEQNQ